MPKYKKRFIDKNSAVTFHLVHRSQHDPLVTDESAPQRVLVEAEPSKNKNIDKEKRVKELQKFGIFFDDDYDYLQHLREKEKDVIEWEKVEPLNNKSKTLDTVPSIQLPSSVFASQYEEPEGVLSKAVSRVGPRPDWDPDVVAALDDGFDYEHPDNVLEDNFMELANAAKNDDEDSCSEDGEYSDIDSDGFSDEEKDELGPLKFQEKLFENDETQSKFTDYSLSSSVIRRNEQLSLLDDRFEKFYDQYDDEEIGPLDLENIDGHIDLQDKLLLQYADDFKKEQEATQYDKNWDAVRLTKLQHYSSSEDLVEIEIEPTKEKWDCESILSTYSNIYNHPNVIQEPVKSKIKIDPKTNLPIDVLNRDQRSKLTAKTLNKLNSQFIDDTSEKEKTLCAQSVLSTLSVLSIRPKDETKEEKNERKRLLREYRTERRIERKMNTEAFTKEKIRQQKRNANNMCNIQGSKIV